MSAEQLGTEETYRYPATLSGSPFLRNYLGKGSLRHVWEDGYFHQLYLDGDPEARAVRKLDVSVLQLYDSLDREANMLQTERLQAEVVNKTERHVQIRRYFGRQRVPLEQFRVVDVWLTRAEVAHMRPDLLGKLAGSGDLFMTQTIESLQDYVPELEPEERANNFSPVADYAEQMERVFLHEDYAVLNDNFVLGGGTYSDEMATLFRQVQTNEELNRLLAETQQNALVAKELKEFISCCIRYSTETGYILDLGEHNVVMTVQGATKLVDALYPKGIEIAWTLGATLQKANRHELLRFQDYIDLLNGRKYVCVVNFLAAHCGLTDRLPLPGAPEAMGEQWYTVLDTLRTLSNRYQLKQATQLYGNTL